MVDAAPFRAIRYDPAVAGDPATTSAPAYDDFERLAYTRHRTASPYTVLQLLTRSATADEPYRDAGATLDRWRRTGVLLEEPTAAFYRYEQHELHDGVPTLQRGVLAAVAVGDATVFGHEATHPARVADRMARMAAVPVDVTPVFALHDPSADVSAVLDEPPPGPPLIACTDEAGGDHRVWAVDDPAAVRRLRDGLAGVRAVIADGHHRWAAAAAAGRRLPTAGRTLVHLVDARSHGPRLKPVHRLVARLPPSAEQRLAAMFVVEPVPTGELVERLAGAAGRAFGLRLPGGRARLLLAADEDALQARIAPQRPPLWRDLDTAVLHEAVLPALDPGAVAYRAEVDDAVAELEASGQGALFVLRPVDVATVFACASAGTPMPAKTTMFSPKPRAGLVLRSLHSG